MRRHGYGPRSTIHQAAVSLALPLNQEREDKLSYLDQYRYSAVQYSTVRRWRTNSHTGSYSS